MSDKFLVGAVNINQQNYTIKDLAPNNYLTIVWHNAEGEEITSFSVDKDKYTEYKNGLFGALNNAISNNKLSYIGQNKYVNLESIAKYISQNVFETSPQRTVVNALIGLISKGGKDIDDSSINLVINMFGEILDKVARHFGFTNPHEVFASLMSENTIEVLKVWGDITQQYIDNVKAKFSRNKDTQNTTTSTTQYTTNENNGIVSMKQYAGLLLGLTTSDTESYEITIPKKKVEQGSDYTTHILPQNFKKDFNVKLTNKVWTSSFDRLQEINEIERIKDKLIEIAQSKIPFDIYIRLSSEKVYKKSNVYFTSLSFTKDESSGDSYECSFSVEPIIEFKTKTFISNRKYVATSDKSIGNVKNKTGAGKTGSSKASKVSSKGNNVSIGIEGPNQAFSNNFKSEQEVLDMIYKTNKMTGSNYLVVQYLKHGPDLPDNIAREQDKFVNAVVRVSADGGYTIKLVPRDLTKPLLQDYYKGNNYPFILDSDKASYDLKTGAINLKNGLQIKVHDTRKKP